jgi:hypothetical protein
MLNDRGVEIGTNDDAARIDPSCICEDGSGDVERRENPIAQQKRVTEVSDTITRVLSYDVAFGVVVSNKSRRSARKINRGVRPVFQQVAVTYSTTVVVITDDCTERVHTAGTAAGCAGWIETSEDSPIGDLETVTRSARSVIAEWVCAHARIGSYDRTRGAETPKSSKQCALEVNRCVLSPTQNETVSDASRVHVTTDNNSQRIDPIWGGGR